MSKIFIGTKPKRFDLIRLLSEQKQNVLICSKIVLNRIVTFWQFQSLKTKSEQNQDDILSHQNVSIYSRLHRKQNGIIANYFQSFFNSLEHFLSAPSCSGTKQNFCIFDK